MHAALVRELNRVAREAKSNVEHLHDIHETSLLSAHKQHLQHIYNIFLPMAFKSFAKRSLEVVKGLQKSQQEDDDIEDASDNYLQTYGAEKVTGVSKTTIKKIKGEMVDGQQEGLTWGQIADNIVNVTGGIIGDARAMIIAQTEMHAAAMQGSKAGAKASGIKDIIKVWHATQDDRTREDHSDADGQEVDIDDTFEVGDDELDMPGDPNGSPEEVINCRCVASYKLPPAKDD